MIKEQDAIKANDQKKAELEKFLDTYQVGSDVSRIKLLASEWKETQRVVVEAGVARLRAHSEHEQALVYWNAAQRLLGDGKKISAATPSFFAALLTPISSPTFSP